MIPAELLAIAQATRDTFGDGVKLKFAADERTGQTWGNVALDIPDWRVVPKSAINAPMTAGPQP